MPMTETAQYLYALAVVSGVAFGVWYYLPYPRFHWRFRVHWLIRANLLRRTPREREDLVRWISNDAGVPFGFAEEYLISLSSSYGVPVGYVYPSDNFAVELSVPKSVLPPRLRRSLSHTQGETTDGGCLEEFVTFEWYADRQTRLPICELETIVACRLRSVTSLCRALYDIEARVKEGERRGQAEGSGLESSKSGPGSGTESHRKGSNLGK